MSDIKSVVSGSFVLGPHPTVTVSAASTKNGETATLPVPRDLGDDLAAWRPEGSSVFPLPDKGAAMLRVDLKAAGIAYRDEGGLVFDFHALRCQCATLADAAGVSPRVVQKPMRHSTLELTGRYTRPRMIDIEGAASALPNLRPTPPDSEGKAATGTDGRRIDDCLAAHLPRAGDVSGRAQKATGGRDARSPIAAPGREPLAASGLGVDWRSLSATVGNSGDGTRTHDLRIMRPPL